MGLRVGTHKPLVASALGIGVLPAAARARALLPAAIWRRSTALGGPRGVAKPGAVAPVLLTATAALLPAASAALLPAAAGSLLPATLAAPGTLLAALALLASP